MRDHNPILIEKFNGLYDRGDVEEVPLDHFSESNNLRFVGSDSFASRHGIINYQDITVPPLTDILRVYNYPMATGNTQLILVEGGDIYHVINDTTMFGPILSIPLMTDFGFVSYAGRAYITPFGTELVEGMNRERGLTGETLYVYLGDGTAARTAAGSGASSASLTITTVAVAPTTPGVHVIGVVWETDTGYLSPPGQLTSCITGPAIGFNGLDISNIEVPADARYVRKLLVASKAINNFDGNLEGYELFFVPLYDNIAIATTSLLAVGFYDEDLVDSAWHLLDNFTDIPAGVNLCIYHDRLCLCTTFDDISLIRVSASGEPEAISQVDGFCLMPPNGDPITNIVELRDVLFSFKRNKTASFVDNGEEPVSWPMTFVDYGLGCGVHGLALAVDSGVSNVDFILVGSYTGVILFNGRYILPELSWKISETWGSQEFKTLNRRIQLVNDAVGQKIYIVMTDGSLLFGDYSNGLDPKKIRWTPWTFSDVEDGPATIILNTVALFNVSELQLGFSGI